MMNMKIDNVQQTLKDDYFEIKTPEISITGRIDKGHKLYLICIDTYMNPPIGMYFPKEGAETIIKAMTNALQNKDLYNIQQKQNEIDERERQYKKNWIKFDDTTKMIFGK